MCPIQHQLINTHAQREHIAITLALLEEQIAQCAHQECTVQVWDLLNLQEIVEQVTYAIQELLFNIQWMKQLDGFVPLVSTALQDQVVDLIAPQAHSTIKQAWLLLSNVKNVLQVTTVLLQD